MKVQTTWLQCTLPKADWDKLNERRQKLGLKWGDIIIPGTLAQLDKMEKATEPKVDDKKTPAVREIEPTKKTTKNKKPATGDHVTNSPPTSPGLAPGAAGGKEENK